MKFLTCIAASPVRIRGRVATTQAFKERIKEANQVEKMESVELVALVAFSTAMTLLAPRYRYS
jgi:hypothetical protein